MFEQYDKSVQTVLDFLIEQGFSKTPRKYFRQATREFRNYLEESCLEYTREIAKAWIESLKPVFRRTKFLYFRRALALVDDAAINGSVINLQFSYDDSSCKYRVPECFKQLLDAYIEQRRKDDNQPSTLQMDSIACTRFLLFLQSKNITDAGTITPIIIKDYHVQATHRTAEGKNAYIRRIRGFFRFLASNELAPKTLEFAFPTEKAHRLSIVNVLSKEQADTIKTFSENSCSPSELRSAAMAILALRMGFRSIDICNLCLTDISWESRIISIVQQKTGVPLTLPFPTEVGNVLARYILNGRPECDEPNLFITLKRPFTRLKSRRGCYSASLAILGPKKSATDVRGLHVIRKTFASNLLAAGNLTSMIASTLGHVGESRIDEYLATDEKRMRTCSIGLTGIEIGEACK